MPNSSTIQQSVPAISSTEAVAKIGESLADLNLYHLQAVRYKWLADTIAKFVPTGSKVGDIGAAPGHISRLLKMLGYDVTSFDFDPDQDMWEPAGVIGFAQRLRNEGITVVHWDAEVDDPSAVPQEASEEGTLDGVVFTEILEHLYRFPFASVRRVGHLVRPGGFIFLTTPNRGYGWFRIKALFGRASDTDFELLKDNFPPHMRHVWQYTLKECCEIVEAAGFEVVLKEVRNFHLWTSILSDGTISDRWQPSSLKQFLKLPFALFLLLFPSFGSTVCVVARKKRKK